VTRTLTLLSVLCCASLAPIARPATAAASHELPAANVRAALAAADRPERPRRFAVPVTIDLGLDAAAWQVLPDGRAGWSLRLHSPGAVTLGAHLRPLVLPEGAELWIHGAAGRAPHGPYTAAQVPPSGLWTPMVGGDALVLELRAPASAVPGVTLRVAEAFHGFAAPGKAGPGDSGACNVDAACEAGDWGTEARSAAMITIANQFYCSGQLLNTVRQDRAPLFLTARHCGAGRERGPADSVNFHFNYATTCGGPDPAPPDATVVGATLLADDEPSDFALLRMNAAAPAGATFAGWDATGAGASSGASLHHPSGDALKISLLGAPATRATVDIGGACEVQAWEVSWSRGTTEGGSSGGGLWNGAHRIVGVLSGGTASCSNTGGVDYFGRLDLAWTARPATDGQLKAHLDPDGTCIASVPGLDPAAQPDATPIASGPQRCQGEASICGSRRDSGGGVPLSLLAVLLGAALSRRRAGTA
jgi:lysyl endopeptidase